MRLSLFLDEVSTRARRGCDVHEATELLSPLAKRFNDVHSTIKRIKRNEFGGEKGEAIHRRFWKAVECFDDTAKLQETMPLATRVLNIGAIADAVANLHGVLDEVLASMGEHSGVNGWRSEFERAKRGHIELLEKKIALKREKLLRDSSLTRETIKLLKNAKGRDDWNDVAEKLWAIVEPLASDDDVPDSRDGYIPTSEVVLRPQPRGRGGFATVYDAKWKGSDVVAKVIHDFDLRKPKQLERLLNEARIGYRLSHPHVIKAHGVCHTRDPPLIVFESAKHGNMCEYLIHHKDEAPKWRMLYQAALGLRFLHSKSIVHGDLKLNNFFVMADGSVKVGDLGLSREKTTSRVSVLSIGNVDGAGAIRWRAPECFVSKPTFASDVYSFGICIYEAMAGRYPYGELPDGGVKMMICKGELPLRPDCIDDEVWDLIEKMTRMKPEERVSLDYVVRELELRSDREREMAESDLTPSETLSTSSQFTDDGNPASARTSRPLKSTAEAYQALYRTKEPDLQLKGLKWLYRYGILVDACAELAELDGVSALEAIAWSSETPPLHKIYAFHILDVGNHRAQFGISLAKMKDLKDTLHQPDKDDVSTLVSRMSSGNSDEDRLEALDLLSMYFFHDFAEGEVSHGAVLIRFLNYPDVRFNAGAAMAIACGARSKMGSALRESVEALITLLKSEEDRCKQCAAISLANLAERSVDDADAIVKAGALDVLVDLVSRGSSGCKEQATRALGNIMAKRPEDSAGILKEVVALVKAVETGSDGCKRETARLLGILSANSYEIREIVVKAGAIGPILGLLKSSIDESKKLAAFAIGNIVEKASEMMIEETGAIYSLADLLKVESSSCKEQAAYALGQLAERSPRSKGTIIVSGAIISLVGMLRIDSSECPERAACALANIVCDSPDMGNPVVFAGAIEPLVTVLKNGSEGSKQQACRALGNLASTSLDNRIKIASAGAIASLVDLLVDFSQVCKEWAAYSLCNLAVDSLENQKKIREARAVRPLVELLKCQSCTTDGWLWVTRALGHLALESCESKREISSAGAIRPLVQLLCSSSESCRDSAASTLATLSSESSNVRPIMEAGALASLVGLLHEGSQICKERAACTLCKLAADSLENQKKLREAGAVRPLIDLLKCESSAAEEWVVLTLGRLVASSPGIEVEILDPGFIDQLVQLLYSGSEDCKYWAVLILESLDSDSSTKKLVVECGAVPALRSLRKHQRIGGHANATLKKLGYGSIMRLFRSKPPSRSTLRS